MPPPLLALALATAPPPARALTPPPSHGKLVSANGYGGVLFDPDHASGAVLSDFRDHLYQQLSADQEPGRDLLYDAYFGLAEAGEGGTWLTTTSAATYEQGTGIFTVDRSADGLRITEYAFAPTLLPGPAYVQLLHVINDGSDTRSLRLFSLNNHHLGSLSEGGSYTGDEAIWVDQGEQSVLGEVGNATGLGMVVLALGSPDSFTCDQLWSRVQSEGQLDGRCGTADAPWTHDDQVGGWQWSVTLGPGQETWVGTVSAAFDGGSPTTAQTAAQAYVEGKQPGELLQDERDGWESWLSSAVLPETATEDELAVYLQSLVFLKMAQVREEGDPFGQIPASLPVASGGDEFQHLWNITWVRDSAYAIAALTAAGYTQEAHDALAFLLQGKAGDYAHLVGQDYGLSVCRLYGDGSEWSDDDGSGPNIELDNFGLLLWAAGTWVAATGDTSFVSDHQGLLLDDIADVLQDLIDEDGLIMADSSIWERHWYGNQQRFAYTQAWAVRGLLDAAAMAALVEDYERVNHYTGASETVQQAICTWMLDGSGVIAASQEQLERGEPHLDLAAVDALNNGTIDAASPQGLASLDAWREGLVTAAGGYRRNDDGDLYDEQEWIWADLRLAQALRRACQPDAARAIEDRVTAAALANHWTIPELLDPDRATFAGPAPMMGFGSGLYVLTLLDRAEADADCADGVAFQCSGGTADGGADGGSADGGDGDGEAPDGGSDGPVDTGLAAGDSGTGDATAGAAGPCGCASASPVSLAALFLSPLLALRRRQP